MPTTQVKTVHATAAGPAGTLLPVELSGGGGAPEPTKAQLKAALAARTGIPAEHQKLLLGAFSQVGGSQAGHGLAPGRRWPRTPFSPSAPCPPTSSSFSSRSW